MTLTDLADSLAAWVLLIPWWAWLALGGVVIRSWWVRRAPQQGVYAQEAYIGIDRPIAVHGRPDRVVWVGRSLRVEELKTRTYATVHESDVWQLSLYKYILRRVQRHPVLEQARVLIQVGDVITPKDVQLKSDREVEALYQRHRALAAGKVQPILCNNRNYCKRCGHHQVRCFPPPIPSTSKR